MGDPVFLEEVRKWGGPWSMLFDHVPIDNAACQRAGITPAVDAMLRELRQAWGTIVVMSIELTSPICPPDEVDDLCLMGWAVYAEDSEFDSYQHWGFTPSSAIYAAWNSLKGGNDDSESWV